MRKIANTPVFLLLFCISILLVSCDTNNDLTTEINSNSFINSHFSSHNEYYKNNSIETVTSSNNSEKTIFYYNQNGDLYKINSFYRDENGDEVFNENNTIIYEFEYKDNLLKQIIYSENSLLTHSDIEYEEGLITKISDFRENELFYFTEYEYNKNNTLKYSKNTRLNSVGVRFGTSPVTFEYNYIYNNNGNLVRIDVSYQGGEYEEGTSYEYPENSNLPNKKGELALTYSYFQ